ncbi:LysR family transcriptional regulator [Thalassococcus sp. BH17M4-6]|uniref:LysR family transcriptional regulator n=1 Tax=Thalassococcus sp. BH17M4-6 TaxID=3413148 RepID=UPI003BC91F38
MKDQPSLDDLRLFLAIADAGSLGGAARTTGVSAPTLGRRMTALEHALSARLFERGAQGYGLTMRGRALLEEMADLRRLSADLSAFADTAPHPRVRITAGMWTARHIARNAARLTGAGTDWWPELLASNANVDIARREADIGVRNRRPEQPWLAGRRTRWIDYAAFAGDASVQGYITLPAQSSSTPSERWLRATHPDRIVTVASDMRLACDMARAGLGRVILPVFAAPSDLQQIGPAIDALGHDEWLVCHHDGRHDPPVRAALDALAGLLAAPDGS